MLFTILFVTVVYKDNGGSLENLNDNIRPVEEVLFNLTSDSINYTSPFDEKLTIEDVITNVIHGIIYSVSVNMMTVLGGSINLSWDCLSGRRKNRPSGSWTTTVISYLKPFRLSVQ